jgi:hypothetical protein
VPVCVERYSAAAAVRSIFSPSLVRWMLVALRLIVVVMSAINDILPHLERDMLLALDQTSAAFRFASYLTFLSYTDSNLTWLACAGVWRSRRGGGPPPSSPCVAALRRSHGGGGGAGRDFLCLQPPGMGRLPRPCPDR